MKSKVEMKTEKKTQKSFSKKKEKIIVTDNLSYEKELYAKGITLIAGVDEVGRGPLVGPVVTAAVILPVNYHLEGLTDSKKLTEKKRNEFYKIIMQDAISVAVGIKDNKVIDAVNIYEATKLAMYEAINKLDVKPEHVLIDAMKLDKLDIPSTSIIKGDLKSESIAAASVIAKVTRDSMMYELDLEYPEYGFKNHKGYPTKSHIESVKQYGLLDNYRFTFSPISDLIKQGGNFERNIRKTHIH
jgi:ribonuclease HII